ncbi:MAG: hypothetical protein OXU68_06410 [Bacteroidota bacterium]|nr:hypothetical protein [Bacteroidota bacterium]
MNTLRLFCVSLLLLPAGLLAAQDGANPPMESFDLEGSDPMALEIADKVMAAMGGRMAWDNTRYLSWSFFGEDQLWDKWTGRFRWQNDSMVVLMNIHTMAGMAYVDGEEIAPAEEFLQGAYRDWVNSGYWLMMPYKLKDSGVTLGYAGEGTMEDGTDAHILTLTFSDVGLTPDNRYEVYVDRKSMLVGQWSYYRGAADQEPGFTLPWQNWQLYGDIMLSDSRGMRTDGTPFELPNVGVYDDLPDSMFEDPSRLDLSVLSAQQ